MMLKFYKKTILISIGLITITISAAFLCVEHTFLNDKLLPAQESAFSWRIDTESDTLQGGSSSVSVNDSVYTLDYDLLVTKDFEYPYATAKFTFIGDENTQKYRDLSSYSTLSFKVKCSPQNVLTYLVYTFDEKLTDREGAAVFRVSGAFFSCKEEWTRVEIDLAHLEVPDWWLNSFKLALSNQDYHLDKVVGFAFGTSGQSPLHTPSNVKISELGFQGHDWRFMYILGFFVLLLWSGYIFWFFKQHTLYLIADIKDKLRKDRPLIAYQQVSIEPQRDREKKLILRFMATEYADADLSLEKMVTKLGVSRTKINEVLKNKLGYTFTAYLNKLRLAEAARLLSEKKGASVAEIAYSVGYKNVPYFNKLFKSEYGCTPKTFKNIYKE